MTRPGFAVIPNIVRHSMQSATLIASDLCKNQKMMNNISPIPRKSLFSFTIRIKLFMRSH